MPSILDPLKRNVPIIKVNYSFISYSSSIASNHIIIFFSVLLDRLKLKSLTIPSAVKDVEQLEFPDTAGENVNWYNHFGKRFSVIY